MQWDTIFNIAFFVGLATLFVDAEPMILLKRMIGLKEERIGENKVLDFIIKLVYCRFCSSFWITLILTLDFQLAVIVSLVVWLIENKI